MELRNLTDRPLSERGPMEQLVAEPAGMGILIHLCAYNPNRALSMELESAILVYTQSRCTYTYKHIYIYTYLFFHLFIIIHNYCLGAAKAELPAAHSWIGWRRCPRPGAFSEGFPRGP